jgi:hypothetical protein
MKTFKEFINESIRDKMVGKSKKDIIDDINKLSLSDHIDMIRKYNLGVEFLPSKEEINDIFFNVGDRPFMIEYDGEVEKIYDTNNKIIKNIYDELYHTQYKSSYHKLQKLFYYYMNHKYIINMIKFWCDDIGINKEYVLKDDIIDNIIERFYKLVSKKEYISIESIISDLIKYYDEDEFKQIAKNVIIYNLGLPDNYLD